MTERCGSSATARNDGGAVTAARWRGTSAVARPGGEVMAARKRGASAVHSAVRWRCGSVVAWPGGVSPGRDGAALFLAVAWARRQRGCGAALPPAVSRRDCCAADALVLRGAFAGFWRMSCGVDAGVALRVCGDGGVLARHPARSLALGQRNGHGAAALPPARARCDSWGVLRGCRAEISGGRRGDVLPSPAAVATSLLQFL